MGCRAYIEYSDKIGDHIIDLGYVTNISNTFTKSSTITPIVSLDMQSGFPIEMANSQSYSIEFIHKNEDRETNREWYEALTRSIDRWQARTDGCKLTLVVDESDGGYLGDILTEVRGYIKSISRIYNADFNDMIRGTLEFAVGTMYVNDTEYVSGSPVTYGDGVEQRYADMNIQITDSRQQTYYLLMDGRSEGNECNLIESMTITGGVESPFEKATIRIPKKKLYEVIPSLKGDIVDRQNRIYIRCMGEHNMYLDQANLKGDVVILSAITDAQVYQLKSVDSIYESTPLEYIKNVLGNANNGVYYDPALNFKTNCTDASDMLVSFPIGTKLWRALQICATLLGGRMFFADNNAYLLKYFSDGADGDPHQPIDDVELYGTGWHEIIDLHGDTFFRKRIISDTEIDPEGFAPVKNTVIISAKDDNGNSAQYPVTDVESMEMYDILSKGTISVPELRGSQAELFGKNHLRYIREPQRSITFTLKEGYGSTGKLDKVWRSYFGVSSQVGKIIDRESEEVITNLTHLKPNVPTPAYNKLILSSYTRKFPAFTCEYTFGTVANISLAENTSQVSNTLNTI